MRYLITVSARNTKRFVMVFINFLFFLIYYFWFCFFFLRIFNRSAATCGGGYRRCSSCVLIDAYKVLECGQHLNQSMVPLMLNARDRFAFSPIKLPSLRETTLSLGVVSSFAYLSFLASLSIFFSLSFFLSLLFQSAHPLFFVSSLSYVPISFPSSLRIERISRILYISTKRKSSYDAPAAIAITDNPRIN